MYIATLFIIAKTWEQPRCSSVSELINRGASQTVEYYSAPKGNELWSVEETWRNLKILKWKKSVWKSCMLYDSSNITFLKRQYYGDSIKISDCQGLGRERWIDRAEKIFRAMKKFCVIPKWWVYVIIYLSKPIEHRAPRMNPNVNYDL